jgi:hypothetical protein
VLDAGDRVEDARDPLPARSSGADLDEQGRRDEGQTSSRSMIKVDQTWQNKNRVFAVQGPDVTITAVRRRQRRPSASVTAY